MINFKSEDKRGQRKKKREWFFIVVALTLIAIFIYKENTTVGVTEYEIMSDKIPDGYDHFRIVQLSDLHDAEFGENHRDLVNKVKMITPDAIFITGDSIDSRRYYLERSLTLIEELQFVAPIYYVTGNHEIATQDTQRIKDGLRNLGVRILSDEADVLTAFPDSSLAIGGIEDPLSSELEDTEAVQASIEQTFQDVPDDMFKILLSHRPEQFQVYVDRDIDLIFSGHAHGGQFRLPGLGGLIAPGQGWFPTFTSGIHEQANTRMVVSRGLGNSLIPIRIFNQPEIVVVTLKKPR